MKILREESRTRDGFREWISRIASSRFRHSRKRHAHGAYATQRRARESDSGIRHGFAYPVARARMHVSRALKSAYRPRRDSPSVRASTSVDLSHGVVSGVPVIDDRRAAAFVYSALSCYALLRDGSGNKRQRGKKKTEKERRKGREIKEI